jgi:hypothetical protein
LSSAPSSVGKKQQLEAAELRHGHQEGALAEPPFPDCDSIAINPEFGSRVTAQLQNTKCLYNNNSYQIRVNKMFKKNKNNQPKCQSI